MKPMKLMNWTGLAIAALTITAFTGSASGVNWHCSGTFESTNYSVLVTPHEVTIVSCKDKDPKNQRVVGGPYKGVEIFGKGEFVGVKSKTGDFSMNSGSLSATLNSGMGHLDLSDVSCR